MLDEKKQDQGVLFKGSGYLVTRGGLLRTPRRDFDLSCVQMVSVRRPLFLVAGGISGALLLFAAAFWRLLYPSEQLGLIAVPLVAVAIASQIGVLRVHSLALGDSELGTMMGPIWTLRKVRTAVTEVMEQRPAQSPEIE